MMISLHSLVLIQILIVSCQQAIVSGQYNNWVPKQVWWREQQQQQQQQQELWPRTNVRQQSEVWNDQQRHVGYVPPNNAAHNGAHTFYDVRGAPGAASQVPLSTWSGVPIVVTSYPSESDVQDKRRASNHNYDHVDYDDDNDNDTQQHQLAVPRLPPLDNGWNLPSLSPTLPPRSAPPNGVDYRAHFDQYLRKYPMRLRPVYAK